MDFAGKRCGTGRVRDGAEGGLASRGVIGSGRRIELSRACRLTGGVAELVSVGFVSISPKPPPSIMKGSRPCTPYSPQPGQVRQEASMIWRARRALCSEGSCVELGLGSKISKNIQLGGYEKVATPFPTLPSPRLQSLMPKPDAPMSLSL